MSGLIRIIISLALLSGLAGCGEKPRRTAVRPKPALMLTDSDGDGMPDAAELRTYNDRQNFRKWFCQVAEMQFYRLSDGWNPEQRDCSGLVRFAWREALKRHDRSWFQAMGEGYEAVAPDVAAYSLDRSPVGEKLFRTEYGSFIPADLANGKFAEFADARTLKNFNVKYIGRDRLRLEPGDLLFFHQPWVQKFPYHVMIFIGEARHASGGEGDWIVYHTGSSPGENGEVKKLRLAVLDRHPDPRWRPLTTNNNFLGFYRLKILD